MIQRNPNCTLCPLHETAEFVCLLGKGPKKTKAMVVGEAPGAREDDSGKPFVGRSGQLLDRLFEEVGLDRDDLYITNAVHCRPPDNRTPTKREIIKCKPWLDEEIKSVKPKYILLLGNTPLLSVLGEKGIKKFRGRPVEKDGVIYLATYHPSFALRDPRQEAPLKADLLTFKSLIEFGGIPKETALNVRLVETDEDLDEMIEDIENNSHLSHDLETTGLYPWEKGARITSFGVGTKDNQWIVLLYHKQTAFPESRHKAIVKRITKAMEGARTAMHNGKFDILWGRVVYGVTIRNDFDTMLAHYVLDENARHGLKELAAVYCQAPNWDVDKEVKSGYDTPKEKLALYHAHDLYYTRRLAGIFIRELRRDEMLLQLFQKLIMPVSRLFVDIEFNGVYIDLKQLDVVRKELNVRLNAAQKVMDKYAPGLNWGSPKQVGDFLFGKLKLKPLDKTGSGGNSTSESVLKRLAEMHEVPRELMKFREAKQQLSFFIDGWSRWLDGDYIHPSFKIHGTVTGRLSSADPNLQQVPRDPLIRSLITAPPGWVLVEADLSQIELRIAAELAGERNMIYAFNNGIDLHWKTVMRELFNSGGYKKEVLETAYKLTGKKLDFTKSIDTMLLAGPDKCVEIWKGWKELRKKAKAINFGYLFGMWWKKFMLYARDNYGVTVTEEEAQQSRKTFFDLYPDLAPWHDKQKRFARKHGFVRSLFGRKRRLPAAQNPRTGSYDFEQQEAERQSINSPVQSVANDINLAAAIEMHQTFDPAWYKPVGTVHDAILQYVREDKLAYVVPRIKKIMSHPKLLDEMGIKLSVPIEAEVAIGPWGKGVNEEKYFKTR